MRKQQQRNEMLNRLQTIERSEHTKKSLEMVEQVLASEEFQRASTIGVTLSRFPEVDTRPLIEAAWNAGKRVAVPKCIRATREMDFRIFTSFDQLETVYMNLLEPIVAETEAVEKDAIDLQIVPGVVFSDEGYRIGFGGGYYDRYLAQFENATLSLAFTCQTGHLLPIEKYDIPVQKIVTEQGVIDCQGEGE